MTKPFKTDSLIVVNNLHASGSVTGPFFTDLQQQIDSIEVSGSVFDPTYLENDITDLQDDLSSLSGSAASDIISLDGRIGTNENDIIDLGNDLTALSGAVALDVNGLQNQIDNIPVFDPTDIENDILNLQGETSDLFVSTSTNASGILQNANDIGNLDSALSVLSGSVAADVVDLQFQIDNLDISGSVFDPTDIENDIADLFVSTSQNANDIGDLNNDLTALSGAVALDVLSLNNDLTSLSGTVAADVVDLQNQIDNFEPAGESFFYSETVDLIEQSGSLALSGTIAASNITTIENDITDLENDLTDLSSSFALDIGSLDGRVSTNENDIIDLGNDLTALSGALAARVEDTENDILFLQGETSDLFVSTSTNASGILQNANDIGDLQNDLSDLSSSVASDIGSLDGRVTTNENDILFLQGETSDLFVSTSTNASDIGDLENDLTDLSSSVALDVIDLQDQIDLIPTGSGGGSLQDAYDDGSVIELGAGFITITGSTTSTAPGNRAIEILTSTNGAGGLIFNRTNNNNQSRDLVGRRQGTANHTFDGNNAWLIKYSNTNTSQFLARNEFDAASVMPFSFTTQPNMGMGKTSAAGEQNHLVLQTNQNKEVIIRSSNASANTWPFKFRCGSTAANGQFTSFSPVRISSSLDVESDINALGGVILPERSTAPAVSRSLAYDAPTGTLAFYDGTQWLKLEGVPY